MRLKLRLRVLELRSSCARSCALEVAPYSARVALEVALSKLRLTVLELRLRLRPSSLRLRAPGKRLELAPGSCALERLGSALVAP